MSSPLFLTLPAELRFEIYEIYLEQHRLVRYRTQPSNEHLRLLLVCAQIYTEAKPILHKYVSLLHERQIRAFIGSKAKFARITHADVANDGRIVQSSSLRSENTLRPLSQLHIALRLLPSLQHLRVFECRQGLPFSLSGFTGSRLLLQSERAMFPADGGPALKSYELLLLPDTRTSPFSVLSSTALERLRLSGDCHLPSSSPMTNLKDISLHGVTGNYFDRHNFSECFTGMQLSSFSYALLTKTGLELRNRHLESLTKSSGHSLRRLVLLECNRLTSTVISNCLASLPNLEYFALSLVTVEELQTNFLLALPDTVQVLKLKVINAWYASPLSAEERSLCDGVERLLLRDRPPSVVKVDFRSRLMEGEGRAERWQIIATERHTEFSSGSWTEQECI